MSRRDAKSPDNSAERLLRSSDGGGPVALRLDSYRAWCHGGMIDNSPGAVEAMAARVFTKSSAFHPQGKVHEFKQNAGDTP